MKFSKYLVADRYACGIFSETEDRSLFTRGVMSLLEFAEKYPYLVLETEAKDKEEKKTRKPRVKKDPNATPPKKADKDENRKNTKVEFRPFNDLELASTGGKGIANRAEQLNWDLWDRTKILLRMAGVPNPDSLPMLKTQEERNKVIGNIRSALDAIDPESLIQNIQQSGIPVLPNQEWKRQMGIRKLEGLRASVAAQNPESAPKLNAEDAYDMLVKNGLEVINDDEADLQFSQKIISDLVSGKAYIPRNERGSSSDWARHKSTEEDWLGTGAANTGYNPSARPGMIQAITGVSAERNKYFNKRPSGLVTPRMHSFVDSPEGAVKSPYFTRTSSTGPIKDKSKMGWTPEPASSEEERDLVDLYKNKVDPGGKGNKFVTPDAFSHFKKVKGYEHTAIDGQCLLETVSPEEILQRWRELEAQMTSTSLRGPNGNELPIKNSIVGKPMSDEDRKVIGVHPSGEAWRKWDLPELGFSADADAVAQRRLNDDRKRFYDENPELFQQQVVDPATKAVKALITKQGLPIDSVRYNDTVEELVSDVVARMLQYCHTDSFQHDIEARLKLATSLAKIYVGGLTAQELTEKPALSSGEEDSVLDTSNRTGMSARGPLTDRELRDLDKEDPARVMLGGLNTDAMLPEDQEKLLNAIKKIISPTDSGEDLANHLQGIKSRDHQDAIELLIDLATAYKEQIPGLSRVVNDIVATAKKKIELTQEPSQPMPKKVSSSDKPLYTVPTTTTPVKSGSMMDRLRARKQTQ